MKVLSKARECEIKSKTKTVAIAIVGALISFASTAFAQDSRPSPTPGASEAVAVSQSANDKAPVTAAASPVPSPDPGFWHQEEMTGDWGGARSRLKEKGVELEFKLSNFYQGTATGGVRQVSVYNGKFQTITKLDLEKIAGWKFTFIELRTETRFGGPLLPAIGAINPVNTTAIIPKASGSAFAISSLNITKLFPTDLKKGNMIAVQFGRFNLLDLVDENFFGGGGIDKFFNVAQIGPLTVAREVPIITNLGAIAYIRHGEPFISLAVLDPNDHSTTTGIPNFFGDGVTFSPSINLPTKHFGKTAKHTFSANVTTKAYTPFDPNSKFIVPPARLPIAPKRGSWSVGYAFRQYIVERGKKDGWGFFSQISFANKDTSPITTFVNVGIGGNGLIKSRSHDEFGIGYAFTDLSETLKNNLDPLNLRRLRPEHQLEAFYNYHVTPWMRLTGDLQIIRPSRPIATTAVIPGMRLEFIF